MKMVNDDQVYAEDRGDRTYRWRVNRLIQLSNDLDVCEVELKFINRSSLIPEIDCAKRYVDEIGRVLKADLRYPIILSDSGEIMDGRHRILKAMFLGLERIDAVVFEENPEPDWIEDID